MTLTVAAGKLARARAIRAAPRKFNCLNFLANTGSVRQIRRSLFIRT
jgi:hypothetical protein